MVNLKSAEVDRLLRRNLIGFLIKVILFAFLSLSVVCYNDSDSSMSVYSSSNTQANCMGACGAFFAGFAVQYIGIGSFVFAASIIFYKQRSIFRGRTFILLTMLAITATCIIAEKTGRGHEIYLLQKYNYGGLLGHLISRNIPEEYAITALIISSILVIGVNRVLRMLSAATSLVFRNKSHTPTKELQKPKAGVTAFSADVSAPKTQVKNREKAHAEPQKIHVSDKNTHPPSTDGYALPNTNLLYSKRVYLPQEHSDKSHNDREELDFKTKASILEKVLEEFGIRGSVINIRTGPVVTLYEFRPAAGTKSSRIIGLSGDVARSMSVVSARLSVISEKNAIGIELPNNKRALVSLKDLLETSKYKDSTILLPIALGRSIDGTPLFADLTKMPHLLIAGTTGSGKSVAINTMIISLLYRMTPHRCKMIMIDPKTLELSGYEGIPHLLCPVVTDPKKAVSALNWAIKEMEERYTIMSHLGVRNVVGYNEKMSKFIENDQNPQSKIQVGFDQETGKPIYESIFIKPELLPYIVIIVDEMADLMLSTGKEVETAVQRLSQMARAAGIHIIMATQRPSVDVITGVIKANFPTRISFSVTSKIDSRTVIGEQGAEQLLGMGDMLYMASGGKVIRVHGPFISDQEVEAVVKYLKSQGTPNYVQDITAIKETERDKTSKDFQKELAEEDLYNTAIKVVLESKKTSTSYLQRYFRIGYNKAANLTERMEKEGILTPPDHTGKRKINS